MSHIMPFHKLSVKCKDPEKPLTGMNAIVTLDGVEMKGLTFLKLELKPNKIAKILIEMVASVDVEGDVSLGVPYTMDD